MAKFIFSKLKTLYLILPLLPLLLLLLLLPFFKPRTKPTWTYHDAKTNITLRITGHCTTPLTYLGVDSRTHLLSYYDISATPLSTHTPARLNWARVVLLKAVFDICKNVQYFVYSDTDAYLHSRSIARLKQFPSVVYQQGMWSLNSGFSSWRNGRQSVRVLTNWYNRYTPEEDFYAEQRALLYATGNLSTLCEMRENGFLGWHIKGSRLFKTDIADLGRLLSYYERFIVCILMLPFGALVTCLLFVVLRVRVTDSVHGVRPFVQAGVVIGRLLRSDVFVLFCTSAVLMVFLITKTNFIGEWRLYPVKQLSRPNFTHIVPGGAILITKGLLCSGWWCITPVKGSLSGMIHNFLTEISKSRVLSLTIFFFYGIMEIILPRFILACVSVVWLLAAVCVVSGAVNLSNVFIMLDVADGSFGRQRRVFGKWYVGGVKPRANSGTFEVHHDGSDCSGIVDGRVNSRL